MMKTIRTIFLVFLVAVSLVIAGCSEQQNAKNSGLTSTQQKAAAENADAKTMVPLTIFMPTDDARGVKAKAIQVSKDKATPKGALEALLAEEQKNQYSVFPKTLAVQDVQVKDGIAYVTFNDAFLKPVEGGTLTEELELASIVNTLTEDKSIQSVLFLVHGNPVTKLSGHIDMSAPLKRMTNKIIK